MKIKKIILPLLFIIAVIVLDQAVKLWCVNNLKHISTIPIIQDVFHLTYAENTGMAFSLFSGQRWPLVVISIIAIGAIVFLLFKNYFETELGRWAAYCIIGGAIGNLIDRIMYGFVVDLFDFRLINFAIFNVADTFVCIGGGLFILYVIIMIRKEKLQGDIDNTDSTEG